MRFLKLLFILLALNIVTTGFSCNNSMLNVHNGSKKQITVLYSNTAIAYSIEANNIAYYIGDYVLINPDSVMSITISGREDAWHNYIKRGKDKKLYLYIFSVDSLKKYYGGAPMNDLIAAGKYLKVLDYSEKELINKNWKIEYKDN